MDINKFQQVLVITRINGKIQIFDTNGYEVSPDSVIDYIKDVKREQKSEE